MPFTRRVLLPAVGVAAVVGLAGGGCGTKTESQPNPQLQVPEVPPGGHGSKVAPTQDAKKR